MKESIKNIIFDWGGVIIDLNMERCAQGLRTLGFADAHDLRGFYTAIPAIREYEQGLIGRGEFCAQLNALLHRPASEEEIAAVWNMMLDGMPQYKLAALAELKKRYRLFLLSNTNEIHWQGQKESFRCGALGRDQLFERCFLSFEMKLLKPDPAIFVRVLEEAGLKAEETLLIDDNADNCRAAAALGIETYQPAAHEDWRPIFAGIEWK